VKAVGNRSQATGDREQGKETQKQTQKTEEKQNQRHRPRVTGDRNPKAKLFTTEDAEGTRHGGQARGKAKPTARATGWALGNRQPKSKVKNKTFHRKIGNMADSSCSAELIAK